MIYAMVLWIAVSSLLGCALSFVVGELQPWISSASLSLALVIGCYAYQKRTLKFPQRPVSYPVAFLYVLIGVGIYFHSVMLFFQKDNVLWIQNGFNLGDMSFHWGVIRFLAKGAHFWPENLIFMGHRFRYPFGMDMFNALFENLQIPISAHLPLVTMVCLLLSFWLLHATGGPFLVFAVFFSGGLFNFWQATNWDVVQLQSGLDFKNIFLSVLLTQRGFLFALPATLLVYQALQKTFSKEWVPSLTEKIGFGFIWGALGFFHLHSYFFVSLFFGCWILWRREWRHWQITILIAAAIGLPFVGNALWPSADTQELIHFSRGWARKEGDNILGYWLQNMGPWLGAVMTAAVLFYRQKDWQKLAPLAFAFTLFLVFAHVILAPWEWDNIKLIFWCYLFALLLIQDWIWDRRGPLAKVLLFIVFFGPGFFLFVRSLPVYNRGLAWISEKELNKAEVLLGDVDVNDGVVIAPEYEHPAYILGHKLFLGYTGHVWSHGYNHGPREELINQYFSGNPSSIDAFKSAGVKWVYRGTLEFRREIGWTLPAGLTKVGAAVDHELYKIE